MPCPDAGGISFYPLKFIAKQLEKHKLSNLTHLHVIKSKTIKSSEQYNDIVWKKKNEQMNAPIFYVTSVTKVENYMIFRIHLVYNSHMF